MPANRSRTAGWRRSLQQLHERGGALEVAIAPPPAGDGATRDLLWRLHILRLEQDAIVVAPPATLGRRVHLDEGIELVAVFAVGPNRWMFRTMNLGETTDRSSPTGASAIRLAMPTSVQRCQRRRDYRVDTVSLTLPEVDFWPLLDPTSVVLPERANEMRLDPGARTNGTRGTLLLDETIMPEVGPQSRGRLVNIGGGGMGLHVTADEAGVLASHRLFWTRFHLQPLHEAPICATAKLLHTHLNSTRDTYAGMGFDFAFNPSHRRCVVQQISRYVAMQQRRQWRRLAAARRSA